MGGKMSFNVTGGSVSIGQVVQGDAVSLGGDVTVAPADMALRDFRATVEAAAGARGLGATERAALETRIAAIEAAVRAARPDDKTALKRLRGAVEDFRGAFGWAAPLAKGLVAACLPGIGALLK